MRCILTLLLSLVLLNSSGQSTPGFTTDIAHYRSGEKNIFYTWVRQVEKALKLDTIENGFDSLQIRIWYNYPKSQVGDQILCLKNQNSKWNATLYDRMKDTNYSVKPKSNWNSFMAKLYHYNILTLPNMDDIKGLEDNWYDGDSYCVEISDKNHYRLYYYHVPEKFDNKFKDVKDMVNILQLIKKEFGIKLAHWEE